MTNNYSPYFSLGALKQGAESAEAFLVRFAETLSKDESSRLWDGAIWPLRCAMASAKHNEAKRDQAVPS